jgi:DNA-binding CsgD family transcriptional regulator
MLNQNPLILEPKDLNKQLNVIELAEFLSLNLPPRELFLDPWLPKAGLCMLHAYRGVGKTQLSLGIAYAVAKGGSFLTWQAKKPHGVLYIDGEMPGVVLQERLASIVLMNGDPSLPGKLRLITPDLQPHGLPDLATIEGQEIINQYIDDEIGLIILDNISCLAPSVKENDANDRASLQTWILSQRKRGKSVLLIHHSGKGGTQRGTSKKEDVLDTVITLERTKDYDSSQGARFNVKFEKNRGFFGDDAKAFECHLRTDEKGLLFWSTQPIEESLYERVIILFNDGLEQKEIAEELDIHKGTVSKYLKRAGQEGKLIKESM